MKGSMNHVWGFSHPDREMQIKSENETVSHYTHHVLLMAAISSAPFIGTTQIGWNFGDGNVTILAVYRFCAGGLFYGVMLAGVAVMGRVIWWMARNYSQRPSLARCIVLPAMSRRRCFCGLVALYPPVWLCVGRRCRALFTPAICCIWVFRLFLNINREEGLLLQFDARYRRAGPSRVLLAITAILWDTATACLDAKRAGAKASNAAFADDFRSGKSLRRYACHSLA